MTNVTTYPGASARITYIAQTLRRARQRASLSVRELARRAQTSHPTLLAYEKGAKTPNATTLLRILEACGYGVDLELTPRVRERNGLPRGEELRQVLELADQFPSRPGRKLKFPPLKKLV